MTPDYRNALYALIENAVAAAGPTDALYEANVPRTSRANVSESKTIKVIAGPGRFNFGASTQNRALSCVFTIQCWVLPMSESDSDREDALDLAITMAYDLFNAIHNNQSLGGAVCLCDADEYDSEIVSHGGMLKATAYLDGTINPVGVSG
jgi:hypothetical protein